MAFYSLEQRQPATLTILDGLAGDTEEQRLQNLLWATRMTSEAGGTSIVDPTTRAYIQQQSGGGGGGFLANPMVRNVGALAAGGVVGFFLLKALS